MKKLQKRIHFLVACFLLFFFYCSATLLDQVRTLHTIFRLSSPNQSYRLILYLQLKTFLRVHTYNLGRAYLNIAQCFVYNSTFLRLLYQ